MPEGVQKIKLCFWRLQVGQVNELSCHNPISIGAFRVSKLSGRSLSCLKKSRLRSRKIPEDTWKVPGSLQGICDRGLYCKRFQRNCSRDLMEKIAVVVSATGSFHPQHSLPPLLTCNRTMIPVCGVVARLSFHSWKSS